MTLQLKLTRLPLLNDTIVIKQSGGHYFIAAPDSIIIDKAGLLRLIEELLRVGYITPAEWAGILNNVFPFPKEEEDAENEEDSSYTNIR